MDSSYRGEIMVCMENLSDTNYVVTEGQKFAQLILERIGNPEVMEVAELTTTERGEQGFGSTGLSAPCRVDLCEPRGDGTLTKADRRTLTEKLAGRILQDIRNTPRAVTDAEITSLLRLWPFKRNDRRKNVMPEGVTWVHTETFGLQRRRNGKLTLTASTRNAENL